MRKEPYAERGAALIKRLLDVLVSLVILIVSSPFLLIAMFLIWLQDGHSPFYIAPRVGKGSRLFRMVKLRSMIVDADKAKVDSTSANDARITGVGRLIRRCKLDELPQFWNVLIGDMSIVGPRPNVTSGTDLYTSEEKRLLSVKPGITDMASIVFSDEGDILKDSVDPDIDYNQLIRPWKSRLGLFCIDHSSFSLDIKLVFLTAAAILNKEKALQGINKVLSSLGADGELIRMAMRVDPLVPMPPPGAQEIVVTRETV
jgi:lipopolysaccharide/colanic/teichoic acid biosynthesis glycosyltransferase